MLSKPLLTSLAAHIFLENVLGTQRYLAPQFPNALWRVLSWKVDVPVHCHIAAAAGRQLRVCMGPWQVPHRQAWGFVDACSSYAHHCRQGATRRDVHVREAVVKLAQAYCSACAEAQAARLRSSAARLGTLAAVRAGPLGEPLSPAHRQLS